MELSKKAQITGNTTELDEAIRSKVFTGCPVFPEIFQEALIETSIPQYLMTNDSFSSQTWAISVPNRNSDVKSI